LDLWVLEVLLITASVLVLAFFNSSIKVVGWKSRKVGLNVNTAAREIGTSGCLFLIFESFVSFSFLIFTKLRNSPSFHIKIAYILTQVLFLL